MRLGECCLGRADGRLGETLPSVFQAGTLWGKRWHLGLEFRNWGSESWDQARACREHGKSPVSLTCPLGPLATWQQQCAARLPIGARHTGPFGMIRGLYCQGILSLYFWGRLNIFIQLSFFSSFLRPYFTTFTIFYLNIRIDLNFSLDLLQLIGK